MKRLTFEADFGLEDWEETLFFVESDPTGAYDILDIAKREGEKEFDEILINIALRLAEIENILGDDYDYELLSKLVTAYKEGRYIIMRDAEQKGVARLLELSEADRDGRCVVLPCKEGDKLRRDGTEFTADHWNLILTAFADDKSTKSGKRVGLFGAKEAEAALKPAKETGVTNDALDPDPSIVGRNKSWIMGRFLKEE